MSLLCAIFGHQWNRGCKCTSCSSTRDEGHAWEGCKCTCCGNIRDKGHKCGGPNCPTCGKLLSRDEALSHLWAGCKCTSCGASRNEGHSWIGCKCAECGSTRDEGHTCGSPNCPICGKLLGPDEAVHAWDGPKCTVCNATRTIGNYMCDICGTMIEKTSGYSYTTTQVAASVGYWKKVLTDAKVGGDGSDVGLMVQMLCALSTPWIVCIPCASLITADQKEASRLAAAGQSPAGCGPAPGWPSALAAAYAWSLIYDEWPTSVQVNANPITHDPHKGTRCDFCKRIVYGDENLGVLQRQLYEDMVRKGSWFVRVPGPGRPASSGLPELIACMTCLQRAEARP